MGNRYDGNRPYPHPHVICTKCAQIVHPKYGAIGKLSEEIARQTDYWITNHRLDFYGLCPKCQAKG